jgi:hypothetical protein
MVIDEQSNVGFGLKSCDDDKVRKWRGVATCTNLKMQQMESWLRDLPMTSHTFRGNVTRTTSVQPLAEPPRRIGGSLLLTRVIYE